MRLHTVQQTGKMYAICFNVPQIGGFNLHASLNPNLKGTVLYDWTQMMGKF
jgi:methionyl-tRNA formyltransferase